MDVLREFAITAEEGLAGLFIALKPILEPSDHVGVTPPKHFAMEDWSKELDSFLTMTRKDILSGKGLVSHEAALEKAHAEYGLYQKGLLSSGEKDYLDYLSKSLDSVKKK